MKPNRMYDVTSDAPARAPRVSPLALFAALVIGVLSTVGWYHAAPGLLSLIPVSEPIRPVAKITTVPLEVRPNLTAPSWSPTQATGEPDTFVDEDRTTAWAPATEEGGPEHLDLTYAPPLRATEIRIHETCRPGAVTAVELRDLEGRLMMEVAVVDPVRSGASVLSVVVPLTPRPVSHVRVRLDTTRVSGWNEIDAVELVGPAERRWATAATASSWYGGSGASANAKTIPFESIAVSASWSAERATGAPDAGDANVDCSAAWCPREPDRGAEWLELDYPPHLRASGLVIHQSFNPGAVVRAELFDATGARVAEVAAPQGAAARSRQLSLTVPLTARPVTRVKLHLDTKQVTDYNEIDAVQLVGPDGSSWALAARASSHWKSGDPIVSFPSGQP